MNLNTIIISTLLSFLISFISIPLVKKIGFNLNIIAKTNNRTVHKGIIPRIGGVSIYLGLLAGFFVCQRADPQINAIMVAGFLVFMMGLIDDIHDIRPWQKVVVQLLAASIIIFYGKIYLRNVPLPIVINPTIYYWLCVIITYFWIIGITNALNLIDGLDGLCAGVSIISCVTISFISAFYQNRFDIALLAMTLAGGIGGFLVYNKHPASIFMGDCGALFIGFMISVISLLGFGFKSSAFFTLGAPITVLLLPILDTTIAIIRRRLENKSFSEADKNHIHHQLILNLKMPVDLAVYSLWGFTIGAAIISIIYLNNKTAGIIMFIILLLGIEIFIEITGMVHRRYHPILAIINLFLKNEKLPSFTEGDQSFINLLRRKIGEMCERK